MLLFKAFDNGPRGRCSGRSFGSLLEGGFYKGKLYYLCESTG